MNIIQQTSIASAVQSTFPPYMDYTSLSKAPAQQASSDAETMLSVQLEGQLANEYNAVFLTRATSASAQRSADKAAERAQKKQAKKDSADGVDEEGEEGDEEEEPDPKVKGVISAQNNVTREIYTKVADYLTHVSGFINGGFVQARYVLLQAQNMVAEGYSQTQAQYYDNEVQFILESLKDGDKADSIADMFVRNIGEGNTHVIRPSNKFKEGYDVLFTGLPGTTVNFRPFAAARELPTSKFKSDYAMMKADGGRLTLKPGQAALAYGRALVTAIFGADAATRGTQTQRKTVILPFDFDFKKVLADASTKLNGLGIDPRVLHDAFPHNPNFPTIFKKYFSIVAVLDAPEKCVEEKNRNENFMAENSEYPEENLTLDPQISFTFVMHLPKEIVNFITQTPPGGRVSLTSLNTWAILWARGYVKKMGSKAGISPSLVPRYVLSASSTMELVERRKKLEFYTEHGRTNDDHLYVSNVGTFNYCPKADDLALENARNYEKLLEEALQLSFDAGAPLTIKLKTEPHPVFGINDPQYRANRRGFKDSLDKYAGSLQTYSWDYNCILTVGAENNADRLNSTSLSGASIPDELSITDYLRKPFSKSMFQMFVTSKHHIGGGQGGYPTVTQDSFGKDKLNVVDMLTTSPFVHARQLYAYLLSEQSVPPLQELIHRAAKDLNIVNIETDENVSKYEWGFAGRNNLSAGIMAADLRVAPTYTPDQDPMAQIDALYMLFSRALKDASGAPGTNLARVAVQEGTNVDEDERFFEPSHTMHEFGKVYAYLGGRTFYHMMKVLTEVDKKKLMVVNPANPMRLTGFDYIVKEVMPLAVMMSKYIPNAMQIIAKGDELAERNQKNESITEDDIRVPGSKAAAEGKPGMQMFPHQIEGHKFLRNAPRFAVLDVAPGGGKTIEVLSDIACLVRDKLCSKPLIACPSGLVRNWVEDMHKITQGKWNVIPITTDSIKTWGFEKLTEMIANAPRNTVCVVGYSALTRSNQFTVVIGSHVERVSGSLEFVKKFGFDYVALDESHRVKNPSTSTHHTIKQLCTASNVKFVRLATGTLISNKLTDVVGQAAMFSSQIFRTPEEYDAENHEIVDGQSVWKKETPLLARQQLARHSAVITFKRKEWAFMLPLPQEEFIPVSMSKSPEEGGHDHQLMYDAVLKTTLDEIAKALKDRTSDLSKAMKGGDEGEEPIAADGKKNEPKKRPMSDDEKAKAALDTMFDKDGSIKNQGMDDSTLEELSRALGPYLQRLEMMLTDPLGDEFGASYFKGVDRENFVSNKVLKVIERIKLNFEQRPWQQGGRYKKPNPQDEADDDLVLPDVCDYDGKRYVLLPAPGANDNVDLYYAPYISNTPPDKDPRWKEELAGKVIVFCRYIRSVNVIYDALKKLAPNLAKGAVKFHGDVKNKGDNLDAFKSSKIDMSCKTGVQILIANEQSISEGHNLQMASRLIRVEAPWAPGELDQASARIFRPDPKGDFGREHIYLDWILTDNSLEVAKMGRLISKMLSKAQFDEANNPLYEAINDYQLPMKSMGMEALKEKETLADIQAYTSAYQHLAHIVGKEFRHMRETRAAKMFDIEPEQMFEDAKIIPFTPYVPGMKVPNRNGLDLTVMSEWLQDEANPDVLRIKDNPRSLYGMYVHTEMGNGTIKGVNYTREDRRISSVTVLLDNGDEYTGSVGMIHISPELTPEVSKKLPKAPRMTAKQKEQMEKDKIRAAKKAEKEEKKLKTRKKGEMTALEKLKKIELLGKGKKAGTVPKVGSKPKAKPEPVEEEENNNVEFFPMVFNGLLAIDAIVEDDDIELKGHGFDLLKDYAYIKIPDYKQFTAILDWIEGKFYVKKDTMNRLHTLHDSFTSGRGRTFDVEQAPVGELKNFYTMMRKHTLAKTKDDTPNGKPELKIYPSIMNGKLILNVDMATNPIIKRWLNKPIPNAKVKFEHAGEVWLRFGKTIKEIRTIVNDLVEEGFVHTNLDEFNEELDRLKLIHKQITK